MWSSVSIFNLWLSVSCGRPFHPSFVAAPTVPEVILNLRTVFRNECLLFFGFLVFLKHPMIMCFHFGYAKLIWSEIQTFAGLQRTSATTFRTLPAVGEGFKGLFPQKRKMSEKQSNSEHVRAIVHAHCAHPACLSAWGRHYNIHDNTSRGL